jgi:hypothetical protein
MDERIWRTDLFVPTGNNPIIPIDILFALYSTVSDDARIEPNRLLQYLQGQSNVPIIPPMKSPRVNP